MQGHGGLVFGDAPINRRILQRPRPAPCCASHRTAPRVVQALVFVVGSLGLKSGPFLSKMLPLVSSTIETADVRLREFILEQLRSLVNLVRCPASC